MGIEGIGFGATSFGAMTGGRTPPDRADAGSVAFSGSLDDVLAFAAKHPEQRTTLENALMSNGRYGDLFALNQAAKPVPNAVDGAKPGAAKPATPVADADAKKAKTPDYDTPHWEKTRYGDGPAYTLRKPNDPAYRISSSSDWDAMVNSGTVSTSEKAVVSRMSDNEGRLDSVQAWDDQIVTVGAMQKTVNGSGSGELAKQVYEFSQSNPTEYKSLFADKGWTAEKTGKGTNPADYTMSLTVDGKTMTGKPLADYIKDAKNSDHWTTALDPLLKAGRDPAFQTKQITDYVARLDTAVGTTPKSHVKGQSYTHPISDYVTSEKGAALVLDESVNRPAHVENTFGKALDTFYAANPKVSKDPTTWTADERAKYEPQIVSNYQAGRNATNMTDPTPRATHIVGKGSPLSGDPGSFVRVPR